MSMNSNRREFLQHSAVAAAAAVGLGGTAMTSARADHCGEHAAKAVLRLSSQEGRVPGANLSEQLDFMEKHGFEGLEVGGRGLKGRVKELKDALKGRPIKISAICAGFEGWLIAGDKAIRDQAMASMKEILTAAGELESVGMIIVPAFNSQAALPHKEARELLTGFARWDRRAEKPPTGLLVELADFAAKAGTTVILEPLNRDECYFMRTVADGASICKDIENPGLTVMGDFWHMTWEETSDKGAFLTGGRYLSHVHMASRRTRNTPGEDGEADNYVDGFKGLKMIGYQGYVSMECGCKGDKAVAVPAAVKLLREQWDQAQL